MFTTPYAAAGFVNAQLEAANCGKRIPPQMMYNYTTARINAGKAPFIAWSEAEGVDLEDLARWTKAYVAKQVVKAGGTPVPEGQGVLF